MWWHKSVIPTTQEAEGGGLQIQSQSKKLCENLSQNVKNKSGWGTATQRAGDTVLRQSAPEFKPWYHKNKQNCIKGHKNAAKYENKPISFNEPEIVFYK